MEHLHAKCLLSSNLVDLLSFHAQNDKPVTLNLCNCIFEKNVVTMIVIVEGFFEGTKSKPFSLWSSTFEATSHII